MLFFSPIFHMFVLHGGQNLNSNKNRLNLLAGADPERIYEFSKFQCEKMSATMVGRWRKLLILDELKQS